MAVSETLQLIDKVTGPAKAMAEAMLRVEGVTKRLQKDFERLGAMPKLKAIEAPIRAGGKATDDWSKAISKARKEMDREHAAAARVANKVEKIGKNSKTAREPVKRLSGKDALGAFGLGGAIGSGIFTAVAALTAVFDVVKNVVSGAAELAVEFGKGVIEASLLRDKAQALADTLSGGRGTKVLELIKDQAIKTGQSFEELQKATFDARDAGLSFKDAFKLNLVRADIIASGRSAKDADAAIGNMLDEVKKGTKSAAKGMADLKEKFNVVGDGVVAASKSAMTFAGVWNRLKQAGGLIFDKIAEKLGPILDKLAPKVTKWLDEFAKKGGPAEQIIDKIVGGIETLIAITEVAAALIGPFWEGLKVGLAPLGVMIDTIGEALGKAFGEDKASTMKTLEKVVFALGIAIGVAVGAAVTFVAILGAIAATVIAPAVLIGMLVAKLFELGGAALSAGSQLISGLVDGIKNGASRAVQAAQELADKVKNTIKSALKISSPSKEFEKIGGFVSQGFAEGIEGGASEVASAGRTLAVAPMAGVASGGGGSRGGGGSLNLTVNVSANPGATKEDGERMASGLVPIIHREIASFFEGSALGAGA